MKNFKKLRQEKNLSQKEIAITLGVSGPTVSDWENGRKFPSSKNLIRLSELFSCSTDYLLGREDTNGKESVDFFIADDEKILIQKYRVLDDRGRGTVDTILDHEYSLVDEMNLPDEEIERLLEQALRDGQASAVSKARQERGKGASGRAPSR